MTSYNADFMSEAELARLPFAARGRNVLIHPRTTLLNVENIALGDNVRIDLDVVILAGGPVRIGSYVHIGAQSYLAGGAGIEMEDFSGLSQGVKLYSTSDDYSGRHLTNPTVPEARLGVRRAPVRLGRHVIIGAGAVVLPGVTLGEGSAVGALSLVRRDVEAWTIQAGVPARKVATRSRELLEHERALLRGSDDAGE